MGINVTFREDESQVYADDGAMNLVTIRRKLLNELGTCFGKDLYAAEINYLIQYEWALTVEDVIWRRTKRGLYLNEDEISSISQYMQEHPHIIARSS